MPRFHRKKQLNRKQKKLIGFLVLLFVAVLLYAFPPLREALSFLPFIDEPRESTPVTGDLDLHFIDVGQGDASLILTPEGDVLLIDTGTSETKELLVEYIKALNVNTIDLLILTHPHADHIGGAAHVFDNFVIEEVWLPDAVSTTVTYQRVLERIEDEGCPLTVPKPKDSVRLGTALLTCLGPVTEYDDLNDMSLIVRVDYGETSFLFTGDAESPAEADMMAYHPSSAFLAAVKPTIAVASCGKNNEYGHPHREIIAAMARDNITFYRTDQQGTVVLTSDGKTVTCLSVANRS